MERLGAAGASWPRCRSWRRCRPWPGPRRARRRGGPRWWSPGRPRARRRGRPRDGSGRRLRDGSARRRCADSARPMVSPGGRSGTARPASGPPTDATTRRAGGCAPAEPAGPARPVPTTREQPSSSGGSPTGASASTTEPPCTRWGTGAPRCSARASPSVAAPTGPDQRTSTSSARTRRPGTWTVIRISMPGTLGASPVTPAELSTGVTFGVHRSARWGWLVREHEAAPARSHEEGRGRGGRRPDARGRGPRADPSLGARPRARRGRGAPARPGRRHRLRRTLGARRDARAGRSGCRVESGVGQRRRLRSAAAVLRRPAGRGDLGQRAVAGLRGARRRRRADDHPPGARAGPRPRRADAQVLRATGRPQLAVRRRRPPRRQPPARRHPRHHPGALVRQHPQVRRQGRLDRRPRPPRHADARRRPASSRRPSPPG